MLLVYPWSSIINEQKLQLQEPPEKRQKGHTALITLGFFSIWIFFCGETLQEPLESV